MCVCSLKLASNMRRSVSPVREEVGMYTAGGVGFRAALVMGAVLSLVLFFVPVPNHSLKTLNTPVGFVLRDDAQLFYAPASVPPPSGTLLDLYAFPDAAIGAQVAEVLENDLYKYGKGLARVPVTDSVFAAMPEGYLVVEAFAHMWLPVDALLRYALLGLGIAACVVLAMWWWWDDNTKKYGHVFHLGVETAYGSIRAICTALETVALFAAVGVHSVIALSTIGLQFGTIEILYLVQRRFYYAAKPSSDGYSTLAIPMQPMGASGRKLQKQESIVMESSHTEHQHSLAWTMIGTILASFVYWAVRVHNYGTAFEMPGSGWDQWNMRVHPALITVFYIYMLVRFAPMLAFSACVLWGDAYNYTKHHFFSYVVAGYLCTVTLWGFIVTVFGNTISKLADDGL